MCIDQATDQIYIDVMEKTMLRKFLENLIKTPTHAVAKRQGDAKILFQTEYGKPLYEISRAGIIRK